MGVDNKGIGQIMGLSLKKTTEKMGASQIAPNAANISSDYSRNAQFALTIAVKAETKENFQSLSGKSPLQRTTEQNLHDCYSALTGNKSNDGYPQDAQKSLKGIADYIKQKENNLANAVGFKPQRSSNLSGDAFMNSLTDRLSQVTRVENQFKQLAFNMPGRAILS